MAPLTEPAFARLRSVDPVLAEAAGDAAFELETDLFAALAKGIMEKGASDAFPFAWASLAAQIGEVSPERVLEAGSALEAFGKKTANALLGAAKAVRSGKIGMERLAALPLVDDEQLTLGENNTVTLPAGMQIDLGGIAKGYIADRVAALVRGRCSGAMLNFGGNVYAVGTKPDGSAYRVGVQDPDEPNSSTPTGLMSVTNSSSPIGVVSVIDRSVVTSGIYERGFTIDGVRYHHILSPWTGLPSDSDLASATIIAESSMDADALATACIVLGSEKALQLTQENGYPALMILRDGTVMMNDQMKQWGYTSLR